MKRPTSQQDADDRDRLTEELPALIRREIRAASIFSGAVAKKTGIHPTDIRCLDFLSEHGPATAGELAVVTGLTTGAMTAAIDRMERAGLARRTADANDQRKVVVDILKGNFNRLRPTRDLFADEIPSLLSGYKKSELQAIADWNRQITSLLQNTANELGSKGKKKQRSA